MRTTSPTSHRRTLLWNSIGLIVASVISSIAVFGGKGNQASLLIERAPSGLLMGLAYLVIAIVLFAAVTTLAHRQRPLSR